MLIVRIWGDKCNIRGGTHSNLTSSETNRVSEEVKYVPLIISFSYLSQHSSGLNVKLLIKSCDNTTEIMAGDSRFSCEIIHLILFYQIIPLFD